MGVKFVVAMAIAAVASGHWQVTQQQDKLTGATEVHAELRGDTASLIVMCTPGDRNLLLVFKPDAFLGGRGTGYDLRDFLYSIDSGPVHRDSWKYLDDYAVAYDTKTARAVLHQLTFGKHLVVRAQRYDNRLVDAEFDLTGTQEAVTQVAASCATNI